MSGGFAQVEAAFGKCSLRKSEAHCGQDLPKVAGFGGCNLTCADFVLQEVVEANFFKGPQR